MVISTAVLSLSSPFCTQQPESPSENMNQSMSLPHSNRPPSEETPNSLQARWCDSDLLRPPLLSSAHCLPGSSHWSFLSDLRTSGVMHITGPLTKRSFQACFLLLVPDSAQMHFLRKRLTDNSIYKNHCARHIPLCLHVCFLRSTHTYMESPPAPPPPPPSFPLIDVFTCLSHSFYETRMQHQKTCLSCSLCCVPSAWFSASHINHWLNFTQMKGLLPIWHFRDDTYLKPSSRRNWQRS